MPAMRLDAVYLPGGFAMNSSLLRTLRRMTLFGQPDFNNRICGSSASARKSAYAPSQDVVRDL